MRPAVKDHDAFDVFERDAWATNDAAAYERLFGPITSHVIPALLDAVAARAGARVLDVATGPGYVAARAAALGAIVTGVDRSPQMLATARAQFPQLHFVEGDAEALSFPDDTFDVAVASFCILHLAHPERCASELARVVKPGGRVGVTVWNTPDRARLFGVVLEAARAAGAVPPVDLPAGPEFTRFSDEGEMTKLLAGAGLRDPVVETIDWLTRIPSVEFLWDGFANGTARTRALLLGQTPEVQAAIRRELAVTMAPYREGDGYRIPVSVKIGVAVQ